MQTDTTPSDNADADEKDRTFVASNKPNDDDTAERAPFATRSWWSP